MNEEKYTLIKNNKITFAYSSTNSGIYLSAIDETPNVVGKCHFDIVKKFSDENHELKEVYCRLYSIGIEEDEFYRVGLGSALIKQVEEYALAKNCHKIEGWFSPIDRDNEATKRFYERNGFKFKRDEEHQKTLVIKELNQ